MVINLHVQTFCESDGYRCLRIFPMVANVFGFRWLPMSSDLSDGCPDGCQYLRNVRWLLANVFGTSDGHQYLRVSPMATDVFGSFRWLPMSSDLATIRRVP